MILFSQQQKTRNTLYPIRVCGDVRPGGSQPRGERGRHDNDGAGRQHIGAGRVGRGQRVCGRRRQRLQRDEIKDGIEGRGAAQPANT